MGVLSGPEKWLMGIGFLAVVVFAAYVQGMRDQSKTDAISYGRKLTQAQNKLQKATEDARAQELAWSQKLTQVQADGRNQLDQARADARAANASADGMRQQLRRLASRATDSGAASTPAGREARDAETIRLLSELLESANDRATALAEVADRAYASGLICERSYDATASAPAADRRTDQVRSR